VAEKLFVSGELICSPELHLGRWFVLTVHST